MKREGIGGREGGREGARKREDEKIQKKRRRRISYQSDKGERIWHDGQYTDRKKNTHNYCRLQYPSFNKFIPRLHEKGISKEFQFIVILCIGKAAAATTTPATTISPLPSTTSAALREYENRQRKGEAILKEKLHDVSARLTIKYNTFYARLLI